MEAGLQRLVVLITGTSSGIGRETAHLFLKNGFEVVGLDIKPATIFNENYTHYECDVCDVDQLPDLLGITNLVNNAGTVDEQSAVQTNLIGYVNVAEKYAFQPTMTSVVNVGSISSRTGIDRPLYCASQGGRSSYTKNLAIRLAKANGATCNEVAFGAVQTSLEPKLYENVQMMKAVAEESLLKKWVPIEEAAEWVFFVSTRNRSMTGQSMLIDNGEEANHNFIDWR